MMNRITKVLEDILTNDEALEFCKGKDCKSYKDCETKELFCIKQAVNALELWVLKV